jgi:uncharacterized membrane protein
MTDEPTHDEMSGSGTSTTAATTTDRTEEVALGLVTDGAHTLIVAQFPEMEDAKAAYEVLKEIERGSSLKIDGVIVASCDAEGKIHLGDVTDHSTREGLAWGAVGGAVLGLIFPPSIIGSAIAVGGMGALVGKVGNIFHRSDIAKELADVMEPNTAGIIALVEDTAVVEVQKALAEADRIVSKAIDEQVAAEIDREAARAKESLATS